MKDLKLIGALMSPSLWLGLLLAALALLGAGGAIGYRLADTLADNRALKVEQAAAKERLAHADALLAANGKVAALTDARRTDIDKIAVKHTEEMKDAETKIAGLRADVRSGAVRLSIAVRAATRAGSDQASGDPSPSGGDPEEARAELMPATADALISIAADGDDAVRDFNACHDAYEAIRLRSIEP
jgi:prophage endopeptidase